MEPRRRLQARTPAQKAVPTNGDGRLALCRRRRARSRRTSQVTSDHDLGLNDGLATQHDVLRADEDGLAGNLVARVLFFCSPLRKASAPMTRAVGDVRRERWERNVTAKKEKKKSRTDRLNVLSTRRAARHLEGGGAGPEVLQYIVRSNFDRLSRGCGLVVGTSLPSPPTLDLLANAWVAGRVELPLLMEGRDLT